MPMSMLPGERGILPGLAGQAVAASAAVLVALWPALLNGFPIVYDDTGLYIAQRHSLHAPFPAAYSIFVWATTKVLPLAFVPLLQACIAVYVVAVGFRTFLQSSPSMSLVLTGLLLALTQLPWLISWLTTDWLGGCGTLALITFWFSRHRWSDLPLLGIAMFAGFAATANLLVLTAVAGLLFAADCLHLRALPLGRKAIMVASAITISFAGTFAYNAVVNHKPALAMGSSARLFSKLVDKGLAHPYLAEQCGLGDTGACRLASEIRHYRGPEEFLWGSSARPALADRDNAWEDRSGRYAALATAIVASYPIESATAALQDAGALAGKLTLSDEGRDLIRHDAPDDAVNGRVRQLYPQNSATFLAARQQQGTLQFFYPAAFYVMITLLSYVGCAGALIAGYKLRQPRLVALAAVIALTLIISTLVHGVLSLPIPRYTVKGSWLATFATMVAMGMIVQARWLETHQGRVG